MDIKRCFTSISGQNNTPQVEREFREICSSYEAQCSISNSPLSQDYRECIDLYHRKTSLYMLDGRRSGLVIYNTENQREEIKTLVTLKAWNHCTCITQLPNGELFCFGNRDFGTTLIIDRNYFVKALPSGPPCSFSSCIYFNDNIYCFGGLNRGSVLTLSKKFDIYENRWINLTPMPWTDYLCHSVLVNRNIFICGYINPYILLYSIDINSFSIIPYDFSSYKSKILINAERLYLIEFDCGLIYESQDEYKWKPISRSIINKSLGRSYCSYNKGGIYMAISTSYKRYFKFDLNQKIMIPL